MLCYSQISLSTYTTYVCYYITYRGARHTRTIHIACYAALLGYIICIIVAREISSAYHRTIRTRDDDGRDRSSTMHAC